jgi:damage-control phosphatase, subfamily I
MKITRECIPCFARQAFDAAEVGDLTTDQREKLVRRVLNHVASADWNCPSPILGREIQRFLKEACGRPDPYAAQKKHQTETALSLLPRMHEMVANAEAPFVEAVRFSIAGNAIDLGSAGHINTEALNSFTSSISTPLPPETLAAARQLETDVRAADTVLFLTDNCGEVIFDRPLMHLIGSRKLVVGMRGFPTINDATIHDASMCDFPHNYRTVSNGSDIPGTWLPECDPDFREIFAQADVVIAKGQGNYETLSDSDRSIYFLLLVKCPAIAKNTGCEPGTYFMQKAG